MSYGRFKDFSSTLDQKRVRTNGQSSDTGNLGEINRPSNNYERYKRSLHAIFDGKVPLPEHLRIDRENATKDEPKDDSKRDKHQITSKNTVLRQRGRRLPSASSTLYSEHMAKIAKAITPSEINLALDSYFSAGLKLPEEEEVLSKALGHRDDDVVQKALLSITNILKKGPSKSPRLLKSRIQNAALMAITKKTHSLCQEVLAAMTSKAA